MLGVCKALEAFPRSLSLPELGIVSGSALFWKMELLLARMLGVPCLSSTAAAGDEVAQAAKLAFDMVLVRVWLRRLDGVRVTGILRPRRAHPATPARTS